MKPTKRLDSAVFQLTPTRTRCDLVIISNGKTEKIASGLFSPFLAHLKSAQDQIDKGGYSITLQPDPDRDAPWFTKGTVERFVRFVSTPEILERVNTIESEILQIEEAIAIQGNESLGLTAVEVHRKQSVDYVEGGKPGGSNDAEKAIVLYKPGADPPQINGSIVETENSKVQLMKVLETRRTVLRKEQEMAFARALAAGFDMDHMAHLVSFSECFGAARLLVACMKFIELWKGKHETGQWSEIEATEALPMRSDFSPLNVSGIVLSGSNGERSVEPNGKDNNDDKGPPGNSQFMLGPHGYPQGQFQNSMFPQWPLHSPPGAGVFQSYPLQGMPYYPNYPGGGSFFHSPYDQMEDPRSNSRRIKKKKHSMDSKKSSGDSDAGDGVSSTRSPNESETGVSEGKARHKKTSRSGKKRSGVVVIRNINYIASKNHNASGSEQESDSSSEMGEETDASHRHGKKSSRSKAVHSSLGEPEDLCNEEGFRKQDTDSGNWQVFQSFLLRNEENATSASDRIVFSNEKGTLVKRGPNNSDPFLNPDQESNNIADDRIMEFDTIDGRIVRRNRQMAPEDYLISSNGQTIPVANQANVKFGEMEGRGTGYRLRTHDDFTTYGREWQPNGRSTLDPLAESGVYVHSDKSPRHNINDESYVVHLRSHSQDSFTTSRGAIYADTVFQANSHKKDVSADKIRNQTSYQPNDLSLIPDRDIIREPIGCDPTIYYDMENHSKTTVISSETREGMLQGPKKGMELDKEKKVRTSQSGVLTKKPDTVRRGKPSKLNPLAEAQARAEKLRTFKSDLQKAKKEKEEEEIKRLEALKRERQRRIAARGTSSSVQRGTTSLQSRPQVPAKLSSSLHRGSKFSDTEPTSASPLQKNSVRRASTGSGVPQKVTAISKLTSDRLSQNGLSRSVTSLPELKKENRSATIGKKSIPVTRRLSDPTGGSVHHSSVKPSSNVQISKASPSVSKGNNNVNSASLKFQTIDRLEKKNMSDGPQIKKISAIINLDKSKAATLPELKLRAQATHNGVVQTKPTKISPEQIKKDQLTPTPESTKGKSVMERAFQFSDVDESLAIEKTVVMMEHERFIIPVIASQETLKTTVSCRTEIELETGYKGPRDPPVTTSSVPMKDPIKSLPTHQPSYEVAKDDIQKLSTTSHAEKLYQAPHARLSSMESIGDLDHSGALPTTFEIGKNGADSTIKHASNFTVPTSLEKPSDLLAKPPSKEPKGFKRLLKFGKRSQNSSGEERSMDRGGSSADSHAVSLISSSEVASLKHLISEEDSHTGNTSKSSRSFSILSPFRIKSGEKKITA